ncbi:unnamed protein product [Mycena citricolor]|uniref:Uncharacterized protein n=1 Tax=Mycena citricolor TaxID=2018698 RepID=A0AAD2HD75_9AGAR|nr:unnamed protein product [Mycena citricolor]
MTTPTLSATRSTSTPSKSFSLRPVSTSTPPSPTGTNSSPTTTNATTVTTPISPANTANTRRLRELDIPPMAAHSRPHSVDSPQLSSPRALSHPGRPRGLTGHDLMALFPPQAPSLDELRPGPTSGWFARQERAFFARGTIGFGNPTGEDEYAGPSAGKRRAERPNSSAAGGRDRERVALPPFPLPPHPQPGAGPGHHLPAHQARQSHASPRLPPPDVPPSASSPSHPIAEDMDSDDAWRRPMALNERRRSGKHTRRVVVHRA